MNGESFAGFSYTSSTSVDSEVGDILGHSDDVCYYEEEGGDALTMVMLLVVFAVTTSMTTIRIR